MTTTTQEDRAALLVRHQMLGALESIVDEIAAFARRRGLTDLELDDLGIDDDGEGTMALHDRLWPEEDDLQTGEFYEDAARQQALAASIFAVLAGPFGQEFLVSEAMRYARLEALNDAKAQRARESLTKKPS
jgi:hypothetical protein